MIQSKSKTVLFNVIVFFTSFMVGLILIEFIFYILKFPTEVKIQVAHPPNFSETRNNIEFSYNFSTNSRGLRYEEVSFEKLPGSHRIFVIGDSFAEGYGVSEDERFTNYLEKYFSNDDEKIQFINGGITGTGPLRYGRVFLNIGLEYNPDALLICIYANDVSNTSDSCSVDMLYPPKPERYGMRRWLHSIFPRMYTILLEIKRRYTSKRKMKTNDFIQTIVREAQRRGIPQKRIDSWRSAIPEDLIDAVNRQEFNGAILSYGLLFPNHWIDALEINNPLGEAKWIAMTDILAEIIARCREYDIEVGIVYIPCRFQYDPRSYKDWNPWIQGGIIVKKEWLTEKAEVQKRLASWTQMMGLPFLDLTQVFRDAIKIDKTFNYRLDGHWTPEGHEIAGKSIAQWLCEKNAFSFLENQCAKEKYVPTQ